MSETDIRAIGVFDSGAGGLTVLKELKIQFPQESFIYLGDTARLPYGNKSLETILKYSHQIMERLKTLNVKAIVVACNSASAALKNEKSYQGIPIYNVITPSAEEAIKKSETMNIGVVGTYATINTQAYTKAIKTLCPNAEVISQACPLWVPLAEEKWLDDPITNLIVYRYLEPLISKKIDTLILGCTHYVILKLAIQRITRDKVKLIESGQAICQWLKESFNSKKIITNNKSSKVEELFFKGNPTTEIYLTDTNLHFERLTRSILGYDEDIQVFHIDL